VGVTHYTPWVIPACLDFLSRTKDKYDLVHTVSNTFPLEDINEAFAAAEWTGKGQQHTLTRAVVTP
jgi:hypothetical protein